MIPGRRGGIPDGDVLGPFPAASSPRPLTALPALASSRALMVLSSGVLLVLLAPWRPADDRRWPRVPPGRFPPATALRRPGGTFTAGRAQRPSGSSLRLSRRPLGGSPGARRRTAAT